MEVGFTRIAVVTGESQLCAFFHNVAFLYSDRAFLDVGEKRELTVAMIENYVVSGCLFWIHLARDIFVNSVDGFSDPTIGRSKEGFSIAPIILVGFSSGTESFSVLGDEEIVGEALVLGERVVVY